MGAEPIEKVSIIVSKGSFDGIYPALIMANGARMEGIEANLFFTFFGLDAINKARNEHVKVASVGNPGLHLATWVGGVPGMSAMVTHKLGKRMEELDFPSDPGVPRADPRLRSGPLRMQGVRRHVRADQGRLHRRDRRHHHRRRVLRAGRRRPDHLHLTGENHDRGVRRRLLPVHPRRPASPGRPPRPARKPTHVVRVKAWPLELVNGEPLAAALVAEEGPTLRAQVAPDLFEGFDRSRFPTTSLPAMALAGCGLPARSWARGARQPRPPRRGVRRRSRHRGS